MGGFYESIKFRLEIEDGAEDRLIKLELTHFPDVRSTFDSYANGAWTHWQKTESPRRKTIRCYERLFSLLQRMEAEGAERPEELLWGVGIVVWKRPDEQITYPLITKPVELELDKSTMAIRVRPMTRDHRLELDIYHRLDISGVNPLEKYAQMFYASADKTFSPFDPDTFKEVLLSAASQLDPSGVYWPHKSDDSDDRRLPDMSSEMRITDTWVLFARRRSNNIFTEDVRRFMEIVSNANSLEGCAEAIVTEPPEEMDQQKKILFRGISTTGLIGKEAADEVPAAELYFPKPFNGEQLQIIEKLERYDGVVVQGPPGTGKTHTIANIICHFLALGKRVLVTSKGEAALNVITDHIPESIKSLTINLLTSEREGLKQLETSVKKIASEVEKLDLEVLDQKIRETESGIERLHQQLAGLDHDLRGWARKHISQVLFLSEEIKPVDLARKVVEEEPEHEWFPDTLGAGECFNPVFGEEDIRKLRNARKRLGGNLLYVGKHVPAAEDFTSADDLVHLHRDLLRRKELSGHIRGHKVPVLARQTTEVVRLAEKLLTDANRLLGMLPEHEINWFKELRKLWRRQAASGEENALLAQMESICKEMQDLHTRIQGFLGVPLVIPDEAEQNPEVHAALSRGAEGKSPFRLFRGSKEAKAKIKGIKINGGTPVDLDDWAKVREYLGVLRDIHHMALRWNTLCEEFEGPAVEKSRLPAFREMLKHRKTVLTCRALGMQWDRMLPGRTEKVFPRGFDLSRITTDRVELKRLIETLKLHLQCSRLEAAANTLQEQKDLLHGDSGPIAKEINRILNEMVENPAVAERDLRGSWVNAIRELKRVKELAEDFLTVEEVTEQISRSGAPKWSRRLRTELIIEDKDEDPLLPSNWREAWDWSRAASFLKEIDGRIELKKLSRKRIQGEEDIRKEYEHLVETRTWRELKLKLSPRIKSSLQDYLNALTKIGKGTGIRAVRYRRDARRAMMTANRAVPCWIMPHWRVSESLPPELGSFDLVIIDEASQSDVWALPSILRGKKLLVVGDDKQVSPSDIGVSEAEIKLLSSKHLDIVPYGHLLLPGSSIYDLSKTLFASSAGYLREHFRCVESIIAFSNRQFYGGEIRPLRIPTASERLEPPLIDVFVKGGYRDERKKVNQPEAKAIVGEVKTIVSDAKFCGRSIGIVSLLGSEQARLIQDMLVREIGEEKIIGHRIRCGDAMTFQGKEADIIFLSMVVSPGKMTAMSGRTYEQRLNVAASRARDRMYLFRSFDRADLSDRDLRAALLNHFFQPFGMEPAEAEHLRERCESDFERDVFDALIEKGYRVVPQVRAGQYRIDLVVEGEKDRRLAVELDGDRYHTMENWTDDIARQRTLERMGWRFWRCWASSYISDPDGCLNDLQSTLKEHGIEPMLYQSDSSYTTTEHRVIEPEIPTEEEEDSREESQEEPEREQGADHRESDDAFSNSDTIVELNDIVTYLDMDEPEGLKKVRIVQGSSNPDYGEISQRTPLGEAMLGASEGDEIEAFLPTGVSRFHIVAIDKGTRILH